MAIPVLMLDVLESFESEALCDMYHCLVSCSGNKSWVIATMLEHLRFLVCIRCIASKNVIEKYFRLHVGLQCCQKGTYWRNNYSIRAYSNCMNMLFGTELR